MQEIRGPDGGMVTFDIDPFRKHCLLNGLDDIGLTLENVDAIDRLSKGCQDSGAGYSSLAAWSLTVLDGFGVAR